MACDTSHMGVFVGLEHKGRGLYIAWYQCKNCFYLWGWEEHQ